MSKRAVANAEAAQAALDASAQPTVLPVLLRLVRPAAAVVPLAAAMHVAEAAL